MNQEDKEATKKPEVEDEEVTVRVPRAIMEFLREHESDPKIYLEKTILHAFRSDIENDQIWGSENHIKAYNLEKILKLD